MSWRLFVLVAFAAACGSLAVTLVPRAIDVARDAASGTGSNSERRAAVPSFMRPFEPDGTTLEACAGTDAKCMAKAYGNLAYRDGPSAALAKFEQADGDGSLGVSCHAIAHEIGKAALAKYGQVGRAFVDGSAACQSGYYHGILQDALYGVPASELGSRVSTLCDDPQIVSTPHLVNNCLHGLGHGTLIFRNYEVPQALRLCDELADETRRRSCYGGLFMENFTSTYQVKSKWTKEDDVTYPCGAIGEQYRGDCYYAMGGRLAARARGSWTEFAGTCARIASTWSVSCYNSLGAYASVFAQYTPAPVLQACATAPANERECLIGAARSFTSNHPDGARSVALCEASPVRLREACYYGVGNQLSMFVPDEPGRRAACAKLTPTYADACVGVSQGAPAPTA